MGMHGVQSTGSYWSFPNEMGQNGSTHPVCRRGEDSVRSNSYIQIFNDLKDYEVKRS